LVSRVSEIVGDKNRTSTDGGGLTEEK